MAAFLSITPHDPIISRDGRPFGAGQRMGSLDWLYPSVLAGSLRSILGNIVQADFSKQETIDALKKVEISGPFPLWDGKIFLPAPKDIIVKEEEGKDGIKVRSAYAIRPNNIGEDEGCDLPFPKGVLCPAMFSTQEEFKPADVPAYWSAYKMAEWLESTNGKCFLPPPAPQSPGKVKKISEFLPKFQKESRMHVKIDPHLGSAEDEMLFRTIGIDLSLKGKNQGIRLAVRIEPGEGMLDGKSLAALVSEIDCFGAIGGERRLAYWKEEKTKNQNGWNFSKEICDALEKQNGKKRVRLVLATPAIFSQGWIPGWLELNGDSIESINNEIMPSGVKLKLVSACIDRWKPLSGWSLEKTNQRDNRGPKPIKRLVPAGSVYFFEVLEGDAKNLVEKLWLKSICDDKQDRRDGFGLALWGIWDYADEDVNEQD